MSLAPIATHYRRVDDLDTLFDASGDDVSWYAGGTDLIPLQRDGVTTLTTMVDIKESGLGRGIESDGDVWRIGPLTTLSDLEDHDGLADDLAAVRSALGQVATRQIRNRATVAGNLLQRPRCSYFRDAAVECFMKGGDSCPARDGLTEFLAAAPSTSPCIAVQPSDVASVLVMAGASVEIAAAGGSNRTTTVEDLLAGPDDDRRSLHRLADGEVITAVTIPVGGSGRHSTYRKAMDRAVWQFALVGVAAAIEVVDGEISSANLVASGIAAAPHRLGDAEELLVGSALDDDTIARAADASVVGLEPTDDNRYKVTLLAGLVRSALRDLSA